MKTAKLILFFNLSLMALTSWGADELRVRILSKFHPQDLVISSGDKAYQIELGDNKTLDLRHLNSFTIYLPTQDVKRHYPGGVWIEPLDNELLVVNWVDIENYVSQVVLGEMGITEPAAMQAQAILARSYALSKLSPQKKYDISDLAYHQVYPSLSQYSELSRQHTADASSQVLTHEGRIMQTVYHAECGSRIYQGYEVWGKGNPPIASSHRLANNLHGKKWHKFIGFDALHRIFGKGSGPFNLQPNQRVLGVSTGKIWLAIDLFRLKINRVLGWNTLPSNEFVITVAQDGLLFSGRGRGHLVGLCQQQAKLLARQGWHYQEILKLFYPNSELIQHRR